MCKDFSLEVILRSYYNFQSQYFEGYCCDHYGLETPTANSDYCPDFCDPYFNVSIQYLDTTQAPVSTSNYTSPVYENMDTIQGHMFVLHKTNTQWPVSIRAENGS